MRTVYLGTVTNCPIVPKYWEINYWSRDWAASFFSARVAISEPVSYLDGIIRGVNVYVASTGPEGIGVGVEFDLADNKTYVISGDFYNLTATERVVTPPPPPPPPPPEEGVSWLIPVVAIGGALVGLALLAKRRKK